MAEKVDKQQLLDWMKNSSGFVKRRFSDISINNIDRRLLEFYKGPYNKVFNNHLRKRQKSCDYGSLRLDNCVQLIFSELKTFPQYSNEIVYRHELITKSFDEVSTWFSSNKNKVISFPSFLSCSKKKWPEQEITLTIKTKTNTNAYDISAWRTDSETEVIFLQGANFKIEEIDESKRTILLNETDDFPDLVLYENEGFYGIGNDESDCELSMGDLADDF
jgi:hypothetical protein